MANHISSSACSKFSHLVKILVVNFLLFSFLLNNAGRVTKACLCSIISWPTLQYNCTSPPATASNNLNQSSAYCLAGSGSGLGNIAGVITGKPRPRPEGKEVWSPGFSRFLGSSSSDLLWRAILVSWFLGDC